MGFKIGWGGGSGLLLLLSGKNEGGRIICVGGVGFATGGG